MDDLQDILLDGEEVLLSGNPDWENAERPKTGWRAKSGAIKFALIMFISFSAMMAWGAFFDPQAFAGGMLGVLIFLSAISFVVALMIVFGENDYLDPSLIRHDHVYAITETRMIIHDRSKITTQSVIGPVLLEVTTTLNGAVRNLSVSFAQSDSGFAIMYALADAHIPERLLIERFSQRKAEQ